MIVLRIHRTIESAIAAIDRSVSGSGPSVSLDEPEAEVMETLMAERAQFAEPKYPEYVRNIPATIDRNRIQRSEDIIVGKDGVLYQDGYINELFGFSPRYTNVTDESLRDRVDRLRFIQDQLRSRDIAFTVLITPSKAAQYVEYIPDWYLTEHTTPEGYVRPYSRFLRMLQDAGVEYVDSATVFKENGLTNSFPVEGIHWTELSSLPVAQELVNSYTSQTGDQTRQLRITGFTTASRPQSREHDLREILDMRRGVESISVDSGSYYPQVEQVDPSLPPIDSVWMLGGSFLREIENWYTTQQLAENTRVQLNDSEQYPKMAMDTLLCDVSHIIFEVKEQFVFNIGGPALDFGEADFQPVPDTMYNALTRLYVSLGGDDPDLLRGPFRLPVKREIRDNPEPENYFPEYDRQNIPAPPSPPSWEDSTRRIVAGKDGVLFESATINEYHGLTPKYRRVTDAALRKKAEQLAAIEQALREQNIAFALLITPSKASQYAENIPQWYLDQFTLPRNYVRPYTRFLPMLEELNVTHIDSASLLKSLRITNTFSHTGSSWNLIASLEASKALIKLIEEQKGVSRRHLRTIGMEKTAEPISFSVDGQVYDRDQDLLERLYPEGSAKRTTAADPWYYKPEVEVTNMVGKAIEGIRFQGGVFTDEVRYWLVEHEIAVESAAFLYNTWNEDWDTLFRTDNGRNVDFIIIEVNEQDIFNIGGSQPGVGRYDAKEPAADEYNFIDALYQYLTGGEE